MSKQYYFSVIGIAFLVLFAVLSLALTSALAQCTHQGCDHSGQKSGVHSGHQQGGTRSVSQQNPRIRQYPKTFSPVSTTVALVGTLNPHGGQGSVSGSLRFEVVYLPQEIRVYLYDMSNRPISARGVSGRVALTVRGNDKVYRFPLTYVATLDGSHIQDYLAVPANISRIKDGDMNAVFELSNLPSRVQLKARFTQTFALSKIPVKVVELSEADQAGIAEQKVCSVTGGKLGNMGAPVKVLLGDQPIYLCCKRCLGKIQKNPAAYLPKSTPAKPGHEATKTDKITVSKSTSVDKPAIAQQRVCVVTGSRLGGMGTPVKITMNGQSLFLCCKGCVGKVEKDAASYFAKAEQLRSER